MTDVRPSATVSLAPILARIDACGLCAAGPERLGNAVTVRNASGATMEFTVCDRCAAAVRRLSAAAGGAGAGGPARMSFDAAPASVPTAVALTAATQDSAATHDTVGGPVLIHEFQEAFVAGNGVPYVVRVWGQERSDATWIGWLTFVSADGSLSRRTPRETSQSTRDHLAYWATGLEATYLEGALARAS